MTRYRAIRTIIAKILAGAFGLVGVVFLYLGIASAVCGTGPFGLTGAIVIVILGSVLCAVCGLVCLAYGRQTSRCLSCLLGLAVFGEVSTALNGVTDAAVAAGERQWLYAAMLAPVAAGVATYCFMQWIYKRDFESSREEVPADPDVHRDLRR